MKKSNKINIALLPKEVHHLHCRVFKKGIAKKRKAVVNGEEPITKRPMTGSVNGARSGARGITTVSKGGGERVASKSVAKRTSANDTSETKGRTRGRVGGVKLSSKETFKEVELNLGRSARNAWMERNGEVLPEITPFGDSFGTIGTVWTQSIALRNESPMYTTTEYPPSVLDECAVPIPDQDGVAFRRKADATRALYWWIVCTVPSVESRRHWAQELLGEHGSAILVLQHIGIAWCTLSRSTNGSFWLEYKGRKWLLA